MAKQSKNKNIALYILLTGLIAGTLDALSAIIINPSVPPASIFKFVASGFFGRDAFSGGSEMVVYGILFHYFIAFAFTTVLFMLYPFFISTMKNKYTLIIVFGLLIWIVMNKLVLPLSHSRPMPFELTVVLKNIAALIVALGLPITLAADKYYR